MRSTTDEEKAAAKAKKKTNLFMAYHYHAVYTRKGSEYLAKACIAEFPAGILHKAWILLHEMFDKLDTMSMSELREEILKIKLK